MGAVLGKLSGWKGKQVKTKPARRLPLNLPYSADISTNGDAEPLSKSPDLFDACPAGPNFCFPSPIFMPSELTAFVISKRPLAVLIQNFLNIQECKVWNIA